MIKKRKHTRLSDWDYSSEGIYFITICCGNRIPFFGSISKNKKVLSDIGLISTKYWLEIPDHFPHVKLDEFIVMPNHIHGILILDYSLVGPCHGIAINQQDENISICDGSVIDTDKKHNYNQFSKPVRGSVSVIINQYKSSVKRWCNKNGFTKFYWQKQFYEQILQDEISVKNVREYIYRNPKNWLDDDLYET